MERIRIQTATRGEASQHPGIADIFTAAEEGLEQRRIESPEAGGTRLSDPRASLKRRKAGSRIGIPGLGDTESRRVLVLRGGSVAVGAVIFAEDPVAPFLRHQHEGARREPETTRELALQATQPNRRVVTPGSEVVRIDHEFEHGAHREPAARPSRQAGHGQRSRRYSKA